MSSYIAPSRNRSLRKRVSPPALANHFEAPARILKSEPHLDEKRSFGARDRGEAGLQLSKSSSTRSVCGRRRRRHSWWLLYSPRLIGEAGLLAVALW